MDKPSYPLKSSGESKRFEFFSVSYTKRVKKLIQYREFQSSPNFYNLALLDIDEKGRSDDMSISNNGDMEMILATVIKSIGVFLINYPTAKIFFTGSSPARTRLYRIVVSKYLEEASLKYQVHGIIDMKNEPFEAHKNYDAFLIFNKE